MSRCDKDDPIQDAILDAADRLFERYGYRKTTVEEIAQEAQVGKGTVYLRFESKEDLGLSWLARMHGLLFRKMAAIASSPAPTSERIRKVIEARVYLRLEVFERLQCSIDEALEGVGERIHGRRESFNQAESDLIESLLREGIASGDVSTNEPAQTARAIVLATNSLLPYVTRFRPATYRKTIGDETACLVNLLMQAIAPC